MRLQDRLNSFPVIVVAALLLAAVFGLAVGFVTAPGSAPVMPRTADAGNMAEGGDGSGPLSAGKRTRTPRGEGHKEHSGSVRHTPPRSNESGPENGDPRVINPHGTDTEPLPHIQPGEVRKLPEGRVDEIEQLADVEQPHCAIEVSVSDSRGVVLPFALLALDVKSGPLGWHFVPSQPQAIPEQRGRFRFSNLYPGEYRVRSLATNYKPIEETVRLQGETDVKSISLVLDTLEYAQVEFFIRFPDTTSPDEVELRIDRSGNEDTSTQGRFHEYNTDNSTPIRNAGIVAPTRMRQRTAAGGMIKLTLPKGQSTTVVFAAKRDDVRYEGSSTVAPEGGISQEDVELQPADPDNESVLPRNPSKLGNLRVTLTLGGKEAEFTSVTLRKSVLDFQYRPPSTTEGNKFVWQNVFEGQWFLVAESAEFHAPYVAEISVSGDTIQDLDIHTGHLRVTANRASGTPDPSNGEARYRVRLRPRGSGTIERAYNGNLTGKQSDHIDFIVPEGQYDVRVESPENYVKLAVSPVEQNCEMTADGEVALAYTLSAATHLIFQCVDGNGAPIQNAEFLITFHPAGQVPESEKANVEKAGYNGMCDTDMAPSGPVYIMIWAEGSDWANPDKVFEVTLPAYQEKDLGAVVVTQ